MTVQEQTSLDEEAQVRVELLTLRLEVLRRVRKGQCRQRLLQR
jgi:hypothetical protein